MMQQYCNNESIDLLAASLVTCRQSVGKLLVVETRNFSEGVL